MAAIKQLKSDNWKTAIAFKAQDLFVSLKLTVFRQI
jgi:hypothetical protein